MPSPQVHRIFCSGLELSWILSANTICDCWVAGASSEGRGAVRQVLSAVDDGVVFIDRESYLCLPLDRVSFPQDAHVTSIKASCECIDPSLVKYVAAGWTVERELLVLYAVEPVGDLSSDDGTQAAMNLCGFVYFQLNDGAMHHYTVDALRTTVPDDVPLQTISIRSATTRRLQSETRKVI